MTVYIEYVLIDNMVFDFLILWAASKTLKMPTKFWRIFAGSAVGTACAVVAVFCTGVLNIMLKAACLFLMCACCCGINKKIVWHIFLTVAYTFVVGGAIVGLFFLFDIEFSLEREISYNSTVPFGIYLLAVLLAALLIYSLAIFVKARKKVDVYCQKIKVVLSQTHNAVGFLDSGNTLEHNGIPVCFAAGAFKKIAAAEVASCLLKGTAVEISYITMAGEAVAIAVPCQIAVGDKAVEVLLAVSKLKSEVSYDVLLNQIFVEEGKNDAQKIVA